MCNGLLMGVFHEIYITVLKSQVQSEKSDEKNPPYGSKLGGKKN